MVRKDVKVGAVVVAILIAVLIVYVLVVPGGDARQDEVASLPTERVSATDEPTPAAPANPPPESRPQAASNAPADAVAGTPAPVVTAAKTDPFADERWMMALNTGALPQQSRVTPSPASPVRTVDSGASTPTATRLAPVAGNAPATIEPTAGRRDGAATRTHVVQPGESLARIAENVYGSQVYYKQILAANPGIKPEKLRPGMVINLPDVKSVKSQGGADDDAPLPVDGKTEYRVQVGDSLHKIAVKLYGRQDMWERLYDLNKARIGDDPAKLKLGMILQLPQPPTQPQ